MNRIAILIEPTSGYRKELIEGIAEFAHERDWRTSYQPSDLEVVTPPWFSNWQGDGVLADLKTLRQADEVAIKGLPVVNLGRSTLGSAFPFVAADHVAIGRIAFEHLHDRGLRQFAFFGYPRGFGFGTETRGESFQIHATDSGYACYVWAGGDAVNTNLSWEFRRKELASWLQKLPKPVGILAADDDRGIDLLDACVMAGFKVPEEVAVVGCGNDELLCRLSHPTLSSVPLNGKSVGFRAAELLHLLMEGERFLMQSRIPEIPPGQIVIRGSSDVLSLDDEVADNAIRFVRENACHEIGVADVIRFAGCSRSSLELRFKRIIGRTIHAEIQRMKVERAKQLLTETAHPVQWVAEECGLKSAQYLTRVFRAAVGETPANYRRNMSQ